MPRPMSPLHDQQRDHILRTAVRLFAEKGFAGTSMRELATACEVSKPLLYHYFVEKQDLLHEIVSRHVSRYERFVTDLCNDAASPAAVLRDHLDGCQSHAPDALALHRISDQVTPQVHGELNQRVRQSHLRVVAMLQAAVQRLVPDLPPSASHAVADALVHVSWATLEGRDAAMNRQLLADVFIDGVRSVGAVAAGRG